MPKRINGKAKGNRFENDVAKQLSRWTGVEFERTFRSGGGRVKGDIMPIKLFPEWNFVIELKNRESWTLDSFETSSGFAYDWLMKCWDECDAEQLPILIMKKNRQHARIILPESSLSGLVGADFSPRDGLLIKFSLKHAQRKQTINFIGFRLDSLLSARFLHRKSPEDKTSQPIKNLS